jgi:hypothetical protein
MTAIRPLRPITCAGLPNSLGHFHRGGARPSGVPLPKAVPTLTCAGPGAVVAVVWSSVNAGQYRQELAGAGWHASGARFSKPGAAKTIRIASVQAALVAVYRPA